MACITLFAPSAAMATTELRRAVRCEESLTWQDASNIAERQPLSMSWVVVSEENGHRRRVIQWVRSVDQT